MIDNENVEKKTFFNCKNHKKSSTYEFLSELKFGNISSLKKGGKRTKGFVNIVNEFLSRDDVQNMLVTSASKVNLSSSKIYIPEWAKREKLDQTPAIRNGFVNIAGTSCYFNAALAVFFNFDRVQSLLQSSTGENSEWFGTIKHLYDTSLQQVYTPINEFKFIVESDGMEGFRTDNFEYRQGDVSEFLEILMMKMPAEFSELFNVNNPISPIMTFTAPQDFKANFDINLLMRMREYRISQIPLPYGLLISCQRFGLDLRKDHASLDVPERIHLGDVSYKLNGIAIHQGPSMAEGHWKAYCRHGHSQNFFEYDNEKKRILTSKETLEIVKTEFCLLSYERENEIVEIQQNFQFSEESMYIL